jgi:hypothetical protein
MIRAGSVVALVGLSRYYPIIYTNRPFTTWGSGDLQLEIWGWGTTNPRFHVSGNIVAFEWDICILTLITLYGKMPARETNVLIGHGNRLYHI